MRGQVEEAQKVRKVVFLQISWVRAARARRVTFVAWAAYCLRGLTLVGQNGRGGTKIKGADPGRAQRAAETPPVHSLASRRQKPRPCLAPAMTQGAKNYKVRQPPPFWGVKFASAKTRLAPSPTPQLHHQSDRSGLRPSVDRHRYHFYRAISSATLPRRALFRSLLGRKKLDSLAIS